MLLHQTYRPGNSGHLPAQEGIPCRYLPSLLQTQHFVLQLSVSERSLLNAEGQARVSQILERTLWSFKKKEFDTHLFFNGPVGLLPKGNANSPTVLRQNTRRHVKEVFVNDFEPNRRRKAVVWLLQLPLTAA